jgi:hypothetical protein
MTARLSLSAVEEIRTQGAASLSEMDPVQNALQASADPGDIATFKGLMQSVQPAQSAAQTDKAQTVISENPLAKVLTSASANVRRLQENVELSLDKSRTADPDQSPIITMTNIIEAQKNVAELSFYVGEAAKVANSTATSVNTLVKAQ